MFTGPPGGPPGGGGDFIGDPWDGIVVLPPGDGGGNPNDPVPTVSVSVDHSQIYESGTPRLSTQFRFSKPEGTPEIQVNFAIDGTATFGNDYTLSGNTLRSIIIPENSTSATLTVTAFNDSVSDPDETVKATILPGRHYVIGTRSATTTIVDDEPAPPTVNLAVDLATIYEHESSSVATFTISRTGTTSGPMAVGFFLSGTAAYNSDYLGPSATPQNGQLQGTVTIPSGQSSITVAVSTIDDLIDDDNESIVMGILASSSYTIGGGPKTVTIIDNDEPPTLPPSQPVSIIALRQSISEAEPTNPVTFKIMRGGSTDNALVVNYEYIGNATFGVDYTAPGSATTSITIPAGASTVTFEVSAIDDSIDDDNEVAGAALLPGNDYQVSSISSASVTIIDNDDPARANIRIRADKTSIAEATPQIPVTFTFTRDSMLSQALTVNYRLSGNATLGQDYYGPAAANGSVTFAAGYSFVTIQASAIEDLVDDDFESFSLSILPGTGYTYSLSNGGARVYIEDNDGPYYQPPQYVSISVDRDFIHEGSPDVPATFTISRNVPYGDLNVFYYIGGDATLNEDYYMAPSQGGEGDFGYRVITIPSDQFSVSFEAYPVDDEMVEYPEDIHVTLGNGPGYYVYTEQAWYYGYSAMTTIVDDDIVDDAEVPVDIDTDSDNTGVIEGTVSEDAIEMTAPGNVVLLNNDDDNQNSTPDLQEYLSASIDNDLELVKIRKLGPAGADLSGYRIIISSSNYDVLRVRMPYSFFIDISGPPTQFYVEGVGLGGAQVDLILQDPAGVEVGRDSLIFTVIQTNIVAWRPVANVAAPSKVPEDQEESPGVWIRRNGDDDNVNGTADRLDTVGSSFDNDLINIDLYSGTQWLNGMTFKIYFEGPLKVWKDQYKIDSVESGEMATSGWSTAYIEWTSMNPADQIATMRLAAIDPRNEREVAVDKIEIHPLNGIVIFLGGEGQTPADPVQYPNNHGMIQMGIDLHKQDGYDVYLFNEDASNTSGQGAAYDEIVNAVNRRGVTEVSIVGYSHGGGSSYWLAWRLNQNLTGALSEISTPFTIPLTAYIDAIQELTVFPVLSRPPGSMFHVNQYQLNGPIVGAANGGDDDLDRSNRGVTHGTIDDDTAVLSLIDARLKQKSKR